MKSRTLPQDRKKTLPQRVAEADLRRQKQIANQVSVIDRLLAGDRTYDDEMKALHEELAATQVRLDEAETEIARLRGRSG